MKAVIKRIILYLLLVTLPFAVFAAVGESVKNNYHNAFNASLTDKYRRLCSIETQKIVFVGGSSLPFGLRSDLIERELGLCAVDFGVYAALGTKVMCELALDGIDRGDIVVLAPELSAQTYSLYFNADVLWESLNEDRSMIRSLSFDEQKSMAFNYFDFLYNKIRISGSDGIGDGELYARSSFNEYGDLAFSRAKNIMPSGFDKSRLITLSDLCDDAFFDYVNSFIASVRGRGADVFFTFSPQNALAVNYTQDEYDGFTQYLQKKLDCVILGSAADMTYDAKYFYNTNFHLNDTGAILHTANLIGLLKKGLGIDTETSIDVPEIDDPFVPIDPDTPDKDFPFTVENIGGSLYLTSVKDEFKDVTELRLPEEYNNVAVTGTTSGFLNGCSELTTLTIPDCYRVFDVEAFSGCPKLAAVYLETRDPGTTFVPEDGFLDGANASLKLYIKADRKGKFLSDYTWRNYKKFFTTY